jgi:hypothetical protein
MAGVPEGGYNLLSVAARTWEMFEGRRFDGSWQCGGALWPGTREPVVWGGGVRRPPRVRRDGGPGAGQGPQVDGGAPALQRGAVPCCTR